MLCIACVACTDTDPALHCPPPPCSGRAIKTVHEAADGFKLEKAPQDQPAANGVAH